ncbi:zinc finger protein 234-like [Zerene cesonia]|uniref:zinc finger protein 234-like n=1 Tax=Zerene cesonia TaxID=33412 RepID=UPI0018E4F4A7|nr:zinc finger protein 234-like [Zerene cesonia]
MDPLYNDICYGCLNSERKISIINDTTLKECFLDILKNQESQMRLIQLCFECAAILVKIKKFQQKVVFSVQKILNDCVRKSLSQTSLQSKPLFSISISDEDKKETNYEIIDTIKSEIDDTNDGTEFNDKIEYSDTLEYNDKAEYNDDNNDNFSNELEEEISLDVIDTGERDVYKEVRLSKKEIADERQAKRASEEYINAMFKCALCVITFTNREDFDEHTSDKHERKSKFQCAICKCAFNSTISFKYHSRRHRSRFECNACAQRFAYKRDVIKHYNIVHCVGIEQYSNENEDNKLNVQPETTSDVSTKSDTFTCDVCRKVFRWRASLRKHLERHRIESGQKRKPYCEPCKLYFATTSNLRKHVSASSKHQIQLKLSKLKDTPIPSEDKDGYIKNIESVVNESRRMYAASGELVCAPCNRTFSSIATYQQHMRISKKHVTEEDFKYMCSDCGKRFADKTRLKDHIDWEHLKNYVHTCGECQKAFKTRTSLYLHKQVVHQKDKSEHLCDHCGKHFPNHSKLRVHIKAAHSSIAAYKCNSCGARFAWHSCLSRHVRRLHKKNVQQNLKVPDLVRSLARKNSRAPLRVNCSDIKMGVSPFAMSPKCFACSFVLFLILEDFVILSISRFTNAELNSITTVEFFTDSPIRGLGRTLKMSLLISLYSIDNTKLLNY